MLLCDHGGELVPYLLEAVGDGAVYVGLAHRFSLWEVRLEHAVQVTGVLEVAQPLAVRLRCGPPLFLTFTITGGKIAALNILSDPDRVAQLDLTGPGD